MHYEALVVDNDKRTIHELSDVLESLGHGHVTAKTQAEAWDLLRQNRYSYVLLELGIPVRPGRAPRVENGLNLLGQVSRRFGRGRLPVIVVTGHGTNSPDLAVAAMRIGAVDFVKRPLSGDRLDRAILGALGVLGQEKGGARRKSRRVKALGFTGGEMVFRPDAVLLSGVPICGGDRHNRMRRILEVLKEKDVRGVFRACSGTRLADLTGTLGGQNSIAGSIRDFRTHVARVMLEEANISCGREDVIMTTRQGYRLNRQITVRVDEEACDAKRLNNRSDHALPSGSSDGIDEALNERQRWALARLASGVELRAPVLAAHFNCSLSTAKRDLAELKKSGLIEFTGARKTGCYTRVD